MTDVTCIGFDHTLGGWVPNAVRDTGPRGTWTRTHGNSFAVTLLSIAADAAGVPQYSVKFTGTYTLADNCNKLHIQLTGGVYLLGMNPLTDAPVVTFPLDEYADAIKAPSTK
jgi:hypothetical protein